MRAQPILIALALAALVAACSSAARAPSAVAPVQLNGIRWPKTAETLVYGVTVKTDGTLSSLATSETLKTWTIEEKGTIRETIVPLARGGAQVTERFSGFTQSMNGSGQGPLPSFQGLAIRYRVGKDGRVTSVTQPGAKDLQLGTQPALILLKPQAGTSFSALPAGAPRTASPGATWRISPPAQGSTIEGQGRFVGILNGDLVVRVKMSTHAPSGLSMTTTERISLDATTHLLDEESTVQRVHFTETPPAGGQKVEVATTATVTISRVTH